MTIKITKEINVLVYYHTHNTVIIKQFAIFLDIQSKNSIFVFNLKQTNCDAFLEVQFNFVSRVFGRGLSWSEFCPGPPMLPRSMLK